MTDRDETEHSKRSRQEHDQRVVRQQQTQRWDQFLQSIREKISSQRPAWKVFLSYAWEQDEVENEQLQSWLERVQSTLKAAGATDVFFDLTHMNNNIKVAMEKGIAASAVVIIACTPRYAQRVADESSNAAFELRTALKAYAERSIDVKVLPMIVRGSFAEAVPAKLVDFMVRDSTRRSFEDLMTELMPLGIIPGVLGCGVGDAQYTPLVQHFQLTNLPPIKPGFVGRAAVLDTLHTQLAATHNVAVTQRQTLSGLGGIGKTQTALAFAHKFESEYVFCRWLISDTTQTIEGELEQLARKLRVKVDNEDKSVWMANVFEKLQRIDKWLLVFDNVESSDVISPFLPKLLKPGQHIIITSRSHQFSSVLDLDVLEQAEVDELLRVHLKGTSVGNFTPQDASQLGERLGRLPLALSQATAYMRTHGVNIPTYLELLDKIPENLLSKHGGDDLVNYPMSVRSTWLLSIEKIKNESVDAMTMLDYCAWMHADDIPLVWFEQEGIIGSAAKTADALEVLRKYSMVSNGADGTKTIRIHRLVQDVVLFGQSEAGKRGILHGQAKTVEKSCPLHLKTQEEIAMARALVPHLQNMIEVAERIFPANIEAASIMFSLGCIYQHLGNAVRQKELQERALKIEEEHYGPSHFEVAITLTNLGNAHGSLGQPGKQKELLERALKIKEEHYGPDHVEVAKTLTSLGNAYSALGQPGKKKELLERALKIKEEHYGPSHFEVARTLGNLGNAYGSLGQPGKKKELLERALKIQEEHYGPSHFEVAITLGNLGNAYGSLGQPGKQRELLERALKIKEEHYGPSHYRVAQTLSNLGNAYGDLGDSGKKKELLERAWKMREEHYGHNHPKVAKTLRNLAHTYGHLGDIGKKDELMARAQTIMDSCT